MPPKRDRSAQIDMALVAISNSKLVESAHMVETKSSSPRQSPTPHWVGYLLCFGDVARRAVLPRCCLPRW
jgi:hypothetical protein